jgi:hypothetical protein
MKVLKKERNHIHTHTKEREARDTRGAVILTPQNESVLSCEDYVDTNSERSVRFSEDDYEDYCPPGREAIKFDRFSPKILKNLMLPFSR